MARLTVRAKGNVWIGYNDRAQEGKWIWTNTGESGTYTNWNKDEPNNDGDQDCAILWSGQVRNFWDDIECHHEQWFVCEKGRPTDFNLLPSVLCSFIIEIHRVTLKCSADAYTHFPFYWQSSSTEKMKKRVGL